MGQVPIRFKAFAMPSGRSAAAWGWKVIVPVSEGAYHASDLRTSAWGTMGLSTGPSRESSAETDLDEARFPGGGYDGPTPAARRITQILPERQHPSNGHRGPPAA